MWVIVLLPFIIFAVFFRIVRLREYCKNQVAPDALTVNESNGDETVHAGVPVGSPKPCVMAQVVQDTEETSKENDDDAPPVVSPVQRVSTTVRVMSLIRSAMPRNNDARIFLQAERDNLDHGVVDEEEDISVGTRVARYGTRGGASDADHTTHSSTGDFTSNGSSVAMFL